VSRRPLILNNSAVSADVSEQQVPNTASSHAVYITSRNSDAMIGLPWSTVLALVKRHSIKTLTLGPRRTLVPVAALERALTVEHERQRPARALTESEQVNELLATIGLELES